MLNLNGRIATVRSTGERFLVQQVLDSGVYTWGDVISYHGTDAKFIDSKKFKRSEVNIEPIKITHELLGELFEQTRKGSTMHELLMSGDKVVMKKPNGMRFAPAPASSIAHPSRKCPVHGTLMRQRRGPNGGWFWACPTRGETGCNITFNADFTKCSGMEKKEEV